MEWSEINAGLGQAALLLNSLAKRIDVQFAKYASSIHRTSSLTFAMHRYRIVPLGSFSYIEDLNERKGGKFTQLPLYTGRRHFTWDTQ